MPKEIFVVGAAIVRDGRIFAAKRGPGRSQAIAEADYYVVPAEVTAQQ